MRQSRAVLWLIVAAILAWGGAVPASADMGVGETLAGVPVDSALWEVNRDAAGNLYISDFLLPAITVVNPTSGAYTRYTFSWDETPVIMPSDAKPDSGGLIWWSDYWSTFGRINPTNSQVTYWDLTDFLIQPGGLAFASGYVWFTDYAGTTLLRFNPANNQLCQFEVGGGGSYIIAYDGKLWIGDSLEGRILRFDPGTNQLRWWVLPDYAYPQGLAFDADGNLWWADAQLPGRPGSLGRLSPASDQAVVYALPSGADPVMVVPAVEVIWYTDWNGTAGFLDPARASGSATTLTTGTSTPSPTCPPALSSKMQKVDKTTGTFSFPTVNWATVAGTPTGITAFKPPTTTYLPAPYGMASSDGRIWVADQDRVTLSRTPRVPRAPTPSISLSSGNMNLSWPAVTLDEGGGAVTVSSYQVWRGSTPYFRPWDAGVTLAGTPAGTSFPAGSLPAAGASVFFGVRSVADSGLLSRTSARVGAFSFALVPGSAP